MIYRVVAFFFRDPFSGSPCLFFKGVYECIHDIRASYARLQEGQFWRISVQGGPPAVISTVITPLIGVRTPVTHL